MRDKKNRFPMTAIVLLIGVIAVMLIMVILVSNGYSKAVLSQNSNQNTRSSLSYLSTRIKAQDSSDAVTVMKGPQGDCLVLKDITDSGVYEERIYLYDGELKDEYVEENDAFHPDTADTLCSLNSFSVSIENDLVTCTSSEGTVKTALRSEGDSK